MKQHLSYWLIALSILGIVDSTYITYEKLTLTTISCGSGFKCNAVLNSQYANIGPVPLSLLGSIFYLTIFITAVLNQKKFKLKKSFSFITTQELLLIISSIGALFSVYLITLMAFVINAWCKYCIISAITSFTIFLLSLLNSNNAQQSPIILKTTLFKAIHIIYVKLVKPILFLFDAEFIHNLLTKIGKQLGKSIITQKIAAILFSFSHYKLSKNIDGIKFNNPIGLSAGFDYNGELTQILPYVGFGFQTVGTVTLHPYQGNKKPRLGRFVKSQSLLVNKGLKSLGAKIIAKKLAELNFKTPIGISIASTNQHFNSRKEQILDIIQTFQIFEKSKVKHSYYELNISCPNTFGGEPFTTVAALKPLLTALEKLKIEKPIYIKMPIDQTDKKTLQLLKLINKFSINGVVIGNLTKDKTNPSVHPDDKKQWQKIKGNLSGKPTWKRSNRLIKLTKKHFKKRFTIIGCGGVFNGDDALKKLDCGADLVQLITGMIFEGPQILGEINLQLSHPHVQ